MAPLERAARALCALDGHQENATMGGWPLWHSYRSEARAVMEANRDPSTAAVTAAAAKSEEIDRGDFAGIYRTMIDAMLAE